MASKTRAASAYRRKGPQKEPYDVVLIVCEGTKTEPKYFRGLQHAYTLSSLNVRILPPEGNDPVSVVNFAIRQLQSDGDYDRAYCVFDRDGHANYEEALRLIRESDFGKSGRLIGIPSIPCFEIWVLLHYQFSTASHVAAGGVSACDRVVWEVIRHFSTYTKGADHVFASLAPMLDTGLQNAARLAAHNRQTKASNPATEVHTLVDYLVRLKQ
jgi:RloB-like protein